MVMRKFLPLLAIALCGVTACSDRSGTASIGNNAEAMADNLEDAADNAATPATETALENQADAVRATGQNQAEDMRTNDADTNLSNGI